MIVFTFNNGGVDKCNNVTVHAKHIGKCCSAGYALLSTASSLSSAKAPSVLPTLLALSTCFHLALVIPHLLSL